MDANFCRFKRFLVNVTNAPGGYSAKKKKIRVIAKLSPFFPFFAGRSDRTKSSYTVSKLKLLYLTCNSARIDASHVWIPFPGRNGVPIRFVEWRIFVFNRDYF